MVELKGNHDCTNCGLYRSAESVCIMGKGPVPAEVMIVLDSPGFNEDESGNPLDGRMKKFLGDMLKEVGIELRDCFVTNAVKCRPPDGHSVKAGELKACKEYLQMEFEVVKPKYVLLLGAGPFKAVLGAGKITDEHGKVVEKDGMKILPTFSPAIAFRDPKRLPPVKADFQRFAQVVKGKFSDKPDELNLRIIKSFDDFNDFLEDMKQAPVVSFDIETTGLSRFLDKITMIGFSTDDSQWILPVDHPESKFYDKPHIIKQMLELTKGVLEVKKTIRKVGGKKVKKMVKKIITQNGKFDNLFLRHKYGVGFHITFDTMLASHALDENSPNGLKYLARNLLGAPDYDIDKDSKTGGTSLARLAKYCAYDVMYTVRVYHALKEQMQEDEGITKLFQYLIMPAYRAYIDMEMEGVYVYQDRFDAVEKELKDRLEKLEKRMDAIVEKLTGVKKTTKMTGGKKPKRRVLTGINWGSPQQVGEFLFRTLKLPIIEKTDTGAPATGESILLRLRDKHPIVELLIEYRGVKQQISHFIDGWKERMWNDRLWPSFKLHGTVTGRTSCVDPNLQQVPRDPLIRSLIGAPPGWTFVQFDYSQMELRIAAMLSGDPVMKMIFQTGEDIHTATAQILTGKEKPEKEERKKAKPVNFGFLYGMGHRKFVDYARDNYGVKVTEQEAKMFRKRFFEKYAKLPKWHDKQRRIVAAYGQVRNPIGRLRRLPEINSPDQGLRAEAERQAINSPVQGFGSDMTLMAVIEMNNHPKLPLNKVKIVGTVHDAILFMIKDEYLAKAMPVIKSIMEHPKLLDKFGVTIPIPIVADCDVGDWGNGKDWDFKTGRVVA